MFRVTGELCKSIDSAFLIPSYQDNEGLLITLSSIELEDEAINILIVDDGSKYPVCQLLDDYKSKHCIVVLTLDKNRGIIAALNIGLDYLKSHAVRYVFRLDSHDIHVKGRVESQINLIKATGAALVGGAVEYFDEAGKTISTLCLPVDSQQIRSQQAIRSCFIHPSVLMDMDKMNNDCRYSSNFKHAEDYELFLRISQIYVTGNVSLVVTKCLVREGGLSLSNRNKQILSVLRAQLAHFRFDNFYAYVGLVKTLVLLMLPREVVEFIKIKMMKIHR